MNAILFSLPIIGQLETVARHVLDWLHVTFHLPWAWAIVVLTIIVRMLLVPLTVKQIHSMQNLQRFAPQMKEIQKKYKNDKQKQNEELMRFYRENNINPAASCLPMLAQLPVFIALYYSLRTFAKHPPPGSMSWLHFVPNITLPADSSWSGYLLLAVYAGSQIASTLLMSTTMDRMQRNLLLVLPLAFIFIVARFPTGLVIYWMTTNLWTVGQGLVTRRLVPRTTVAPPVKRSSRTPAKTAPAPAPAVAEDPVEAPPATDGDQAPKPQAPPRKVRRKKRSGRR